MTEKYYEQANYLTLTNQMTFPTVIVMSQKVYDSLSAEDQAIVREALDKAVDWGVQEALTREETNLQALKDAGVEILEDVDTSLYNDIAQKIRHHQGLHRKSTTISKKEWRMCRFFLIFLVFY